MSSRLDWLRPCPLPVRLSRTPLPVCGCGAEFEHQPLWRLGLSAHVPTIMGQGCTGRTPVWLTNDSLPALAHPSTTVRHGAEGRALKCASTFVDPARAATHTHTNHHSEHVYAHRPTSSIAVQLCGVPFPPSTELQVRPQQVLRTARLH